MEYKKLNQILLIGTFMFFYSVVWSQITIEQTELPSIGFQAFFLSDTTGNVTVDVGMAGGPQVWDFTQDLLGKMLPYSVLNPAETPYADDFPQANQAVFSMQHLQVDMTELPEVDTLVSMCTYNKITQTQLNLLGKAIMTSIFSGTFPLDTPSVLQPIPLTYGSSWQIVNHMEAALDTTYWSFPIQATIIWDDTSDILVDAFGTLNILSGNFDVLREKIIYNQHITVDIILSGMPLPTFRQHKQRLIYSWVAKNYGSLLQVTSADTALPFNENFSEACEVVRFDRMMVTRFHISVQPDKVTLYPGQSSSCSVSFTPVNQFNEPVHFSVFPLIPGLSAEFNPSEIDSNTYSVLTLNTNPMVKPGIYEIVVSGTSNGMADRDTMTLEILNFPYVYIYPTADTTQIAGDEFWLDVCIGDSSRPVNGLFGTSFVLHFDTTWLEIDSTLTESTILGDLFGDSSEVILVLTPQDSIKGDSLEFGITRTYPNSSVRGCGSVLRIKFRSKSDAPDTTVCFTITSAVANDSVLNPIQLRTRNFYVGIKSLVTVWPGDTDNNGIVNHADLLPIGLCWEQKGYPRSDYPNIRWEAQICKPWPQDRRATYADANGDSIIDQNDVFAISFNWNKTHALGKSAFIPLTSDFENDILRIIILADSVEGFVDIACEVETMENLLGISLEILYDPHKIKIISVERGDFFGESPLFFFRDDDEVGKLGIAITKRGQKGISGSGQVVIIRMQMESKSYLSLIGSVKAVGMSESGNQFDLEVDSSDIYTDVDMGKNRPATFVLYQNYPNPFNSRTAIKYEISQKTHVLIQVYDLLGAEIIILSDKVIDEGCHQVIWDGKNSFGEDVSSGIYYVSIRAGDFHCTRKCIFLR